MYPKSISQKLGADQVIQAAWSHCTTERGKKHFDRVKYSNSEELVQLWIDQTSEVKEILEKGELSLSFKLDFDLQHTAANVKGFYYEVETILDIKDVLIALQQVVGFALQTTDYKQIRALFANIDVDFGLIESIENIIGIDGEIKPNASKALQKLVSEITRLERSIFKNSNNLFNKAKEEGFLADTELGIKNGRVVLPVLSEHKKKIDGVLIDQSGTGKISYMEPLELVNLNNELAELHIQKRQEIIKILRELTAKIASHLTDIKRGIQKLAVFDFIRAKARLAIDWKCSKPKMGSDTAVFKSRHPLLEQRLLADNDTQEIVTLDYQLDSQNRIIVISGPNAGGKSVALKTVGLLQYMFQCGFLVPCAEESTFTLFDNLFVDIGDNQSIESDLSTYSSHLKAAKHIINFCNEDTLVLMDEIGTGTDPMFGGPMAEAVLEEIYKKGAYGVITTHFSNIKTKAKQLKGVSNAAMLFDLDKLEPQYKLQMGQPGSSFVYELASNIGLNKKLIKRAKELTNTKQYDLDALLSEVQSQQEKLRTEQAELNSLSAEAELVRKEYKELKSTLDIQKKEILNQANNDANKLILRANKDIERTIRTIKETKADKVKTQKAREALEQKMTDPLISTEESIPTDLKVGDQVQLINTSSVGEIVELKKNKASVQVGSIITKTAISNLQRVGKSTEKKVKKYINTQSYNEKQAYFRAEKDVRGMRTQEALNEIDKWIDSAIILGVGSLRLLHGKGNGILRSEIRRHLKGNRAVGSIDYERVDLGGEGISIITLI